MKTVLFALVFTSCVGSLFAVECYNCIYGDGVTDKYCTDPFNASSSQPTTSCEGMCAKTFNRVGGEVNSVIRTCFPGSTCPEGCATLGNTETCIYCCSGDKCNGASTVTFGLMAACVTAVAAWINYSW